MIACLFSCEHATCAVPEAFREIFKGSEEILTSTKGWDPGALNLAQAFSMKFRTPLVHGDVTRLLIDLNENGDERWSQFTKGLPESTKNKLVDRHERPYRTALVGRIREDLSRNDGVFHLMIHTEDELEGVVVETPVEGLSGDFAGRWVARLREDGVDVRMARGGAAGGLIEDLKRQFTADRYALLRLKVPQSYFLEGKPLRWETLKKFLLTSLTQVFPSFEMTRAED